jgi:hypothetical protein
MTRNYRPLQDVGAVARTVMEPTINCIALDLLSVFAKHSFNFLFSLFQVSDNWFTYLSAFCASMQKRKCKMFGKPNFLL